MNILYKYTVNISCFFFYQGIPAYAVTKTALLGVIKGLVGSLCPKNIRINGLAPGLIKTKFSQAVSP